MESGDMRAVFGNTSCFGRHTNCINDILPSSLYLLFKYNQTQNKQFYLFKSIEYCIWLVIMFNASETDRLRFLFCRMFCIVVFFVRVFDLMGRYAIGFEYYLTGRPCLRLTNWTNTVWCETKRAKRWVSTHNHRRNLATPDLIGKAPENPSKCALNRSEWITHTQTHSVVVHMGYLHNYHHRTHTVPHRIPLKHLVSYSRPWGMLRWMLELQNTRKAME